MKLRSGNGTMCHFCSTDSVSYNSPASLQLSFEYKIQLKLMVIFVLVKGNHTLMGS